jgi:hypothetical protein
MKSPHLENSSGAFLCISPLGAPSYSLLKIQELKDQTHQNRKRPAGIIILKHLIVWVLISLGYAFFIAEPLMNRLSGNIGEIELFLAILAAGLILIFLTSLIVLIVSLRRRKKKQN